MFIRLVLVVLLVGFGSPSSTASDEQYGFDLLLEAAGLVGPSDSETDAEVEFGDLLAEGDDRDHADDIPDGARGVQTAPEAAAADSTSVASGGKLKYPPGQLWDKAAREARDKETREYVLANPDKRGAAMADGLNAHLGTNYVRSALDIMIKQARSELGLTVKNPKLPRKQSRQRYMIIDGYVKANPTLSNALLEIPLNAKLKAAGFPEISHESFAQIIARSRRRADIPAYSTIVNKTVVRTSIIEEFLRENGGTISSAGKLELLHTRLRASGADLQDSKLRRYVAQIQRDMVAGTLGPAPPSDAMGTTEVSEAVRPAEDNRQDELGDDFSTSDIRDDHLVSGTESVDPIVPGRQVDAYQARHEKIRDFLIANPNLRGLQLTDSLNIHLGTSLRYKTLLNMIREARAELGHHIQPPRAHGNHFRKNLMDEFVKANPSLSIPEMIEAIPAIFDAAGLPQVSDGSVRPMIYQSRVRTGINRLSVQSMNAAARRDVIETFLKDHPGWSTASMADPIQQVMLANGISITDPQLRKSIRRIKWEMESRSSLTGSAVGDMEEGGIAEEAQAESETSDSSDEKGSAPVIPDSVPGTRLRLFLKRPRPDNELKGEGEGEEEGGGDEEGEEEEGEGEAETESDFTDSSDEESSAPVTLGSVPHQNGGSIRLTFKRAGELREHKKRLKLSRAHDSF